MRKINLKNVVWKEGKYYVSWNLNTGVSIFGDTKKEAIKSLQKALELYFDVIKVLKRQGFFFVSQKGPHTKFRKLGKPTKTVIVKMSKKEIPLEPFGGFCFIQKSKEAISEVRENKLSDIPIHYRK